MVWNGTEEEDSCWRSLVTGEGGGEVKGVTDGRLGIVELKDTGTELVRATVVSSMEATREGSWVD